MRPQKHCHFSYKSMSTDLFKVVTSSNITNERLSLAQFTWYIHLNSTMVKRYKHTIYYDNYDGHCFLYSTTTEYVFLYCTVSRFLSGFYVKEGGQTKVCKTIEVLAWVGMPDE